jgi:cytochrome oxidase Cu insertion factor (SCO1/SenC/PrrC family)
MRRRQFVLSLGGGITSWLFAALPGPAQMGFPPEGSNLTFTLTATDGTVVTEQNYRGKWLVVYFGYTFCPDVCPTTMMEIAGALKALGRARTWFKDFSLRSIRNETRPVS